MKNKYVKKTLVFITFFVALTLFMGAVSAANYTINDVKLASTGVKNYTETHGNVPGYVDISSKNSTTPSFLYTLTKTTVQLNSGSTSPVNISSVSNAPSPSGSATGTLYKSEYVNVASNINSFISSNGRAPNYASTSLGNVRYESLVYTYAKVIDFYSDNDRLPNYVTVSNIAGVDSTGVVIDNIAPSVSNNLASGSYNTTKSVTLTATDHVDPNPKVYYSTNGGSTWNYQTKTVTLTLNPGVTTLKYYGRDAAGNTGSTQTATYTINLNLVSNINTGKTYSRIQDAITDSSTLNGHTIEIKSGTYTENIVLNKRLVLRPISGGNVIIRPTDTLTPIITVSSSGNGSTIQGFTFNGTGYSDGIYLNRTSGCNIIGNHVTNNWIGIFLESSSNNTIQNNTVYSNYAIYLANSLNNKIQNNTATDSSYGIELGNSSNNLIQSNILTNNQNGIFLGNTEDNLNGSSNYNIIQNNTISNNQDGITIFGSNNNTITENNIINNTYDGIYLYNSSANINSNRIVGNGEHGLHNSGNGTVNATNNWWGSNNPIVSSNTPSDIYIEGGNVTYTPWLSEDI